MLLKKSNNVHLNWHSKYWENVTIHPLLTTRELLDVLDQLEEEIILRNANAAAYHKQREEMTNNIDDASAIRRALPVRLIVIDSIAAPIRRDFDMMGSSSSNTAAKRASAIFQIAKRLVSRELSLLFPFHLYVHKLTLIASLIEKFGIHVSTCCGGDQSSGLGQHGF